MGANASTAVPVYASGQVLDAARLNLTNAGIPVFSGTATRDAAFDGAGEKALAEGQFCFLEDSNSTLFYTGAAWQAFGGKILQVVGATSSTNVSTTSTTYVTAGLSATITPSLASSKVLIIASTPGNVSDSNEVGSCTIFRGTVAGTNLATGSAAYMTRILTGAYGAFVPVFLDSPNTTSATTYTVGIKSGNGSTTTRAQAFDGTGSIFLFEVGA